MTGIPNNGLRVGRSDTWGADRHQGRALAVWQPTGEIGISRIVLNVSHVHIFRDPFFRPRGEGGGY